MRPESPPSSTPTTSSDYFKTTSPAFAAALIAASALAYLHCDLHTNSRDAVFVFEDPNHEGEELQRRYSAGTFPRVHAHMLAKARGYLMDEKTRMQQGGGYAKR